MKKYLALAAAGAVALSVLATSVVPSQAAKWQNNNQWQGQNWQGNDWKKKKIQGNWQGQQNWQGQNNWQKKNWNGPPKNWSNNNWPKNNWPKNYNNNWPKKYPPQYGNNNIAPFFFGLALGAIATPYLYAEPLYADYSPHQLWCKRHYPNTYNPRTNTYYVRPGVIAVCVSPYSGPIPY